MIEIPLTADPSQAFSVVLSGVKYDVKVKANSRGESWTIDFYQSGAPLVVGVTLASGVDILAQHALPIKGMYVVNVDNPRLGATLENLGTSALLVIVTAEDLALV